MDDNELGRLTRACDRLHGDAHTYAVFLSRPPKCAPERAATVSGNLKRFPTTVAAFRLYHRTWKSFSLSAAAWQSCLFRASAASSSLQTSLLAEETIWYVRRLWVYTRVANGSRGGQAGGRAGVYSCHAWPYYSSMTVDPRLPTMPGRRSALGFHGGVVVVYSIGEMYSIKCMAVVV